MKEINSICVVGLGYVGLPLAIELAKYYEVTGYDIKEARVQSIESNIDPNGEVPTKKLSEAIVTWTSDPNCIKGNDVYIVTVPTPVNQDNIPDLSFVVDASRTIGAVMKSGSIVVFESTVFPGCTEEVCKPTLEEASGLTHGEHFYLGYSPERINPADKTNTLATIKKIVSGCCDDSAEIIEHIYSQIITAGVYRASSIKVAEASKVTENIQRDVNIALINELSTVFNKLGIDTFEVLEAARTKWNFMPFRPGLVGGHCIGVDPYYLISRAQQVGVTTHLMSSARQVNESVVQRVVDNVKKCISEKNPKVLLMGLTFKENCPDIRNSKSIELGRRLTEFSVVDAMDPFVDDVQMAGMNIVNNFSNQPYDCVIISVHHSSFMSIDPEHFRSILSKDGLVFDLLNGFPSIKDYSF